MNLINNIASNTIIDDAYEWLCKRREDYHHNNDIWYLRTHWQSMKPQIQAKLIDGTYRFEPVKRVRTPDSRVYLWTSMDALVLKAVTLVLNEELRPFLGDRCYHIVGKGGSKGAVRDVQAGLEHHEFVFKSDVAGYYDSMNHGVLMKLVKRLVSDENVLYLIQQYMEHLVDEDGELRWVTRGIQFGCPLSPLMGAIYLKPLDDAMKQMDVFYVRYMDDWIILSKTRWKLKRAVRICNQILDKLKVEKHPF